MSVRSSYLSGALLTLALTVSFALTPACSGDDEAAEPAPAADAGGDAPAEGGDAGGLPLLGDDCDPLVPEQCAFPFPSNVYLQDDPTGKNASGKSVRFGATTLPRTLGTRPVDPALLYDLDGFSPGQAALAFFENVSNEGLADPDSIASSLDATSSPTILLDAESGELVPHWVDIDASAKNKGLDDLPDERAFMIRPAVRLKDGTRYIVAIRRVKNRSGGVIEPSSAFKALRDGTPHEHPSIELRRSLYADIFNELSMAGVGKDDLQLAWDYTTASKEGTTRLLLAARDDALKTVGADGPSFVVKSVDDNPNPEVLRRITLTVTFPMYLTNPDDYHDGAPESVLVLDDKGLPKQNGTMEMDVLVHVPNSVSGGEKHALLQNGHGLFGSKEEGQGGYLVRMANGYKWIAFAIDLFGFRGEDVNLAINALSVRPALLRSFVDRQIQGHVNQLLVMRMMMGRVARDGIKDASGNVLLDPSLIDPSIRAYRGDSQGGIMGTTYMAVSTDVTRGLLGEAGMPYNLLLNRSQDWPGYGIVLGSSYANALDQQMMLSLIQMMWDRTEPNGFAPYITNDTLPNTPSHNVLIHDALGDHQVTTYGSHIIARAIGAKLLKSDDPNQPVVRPVFGLEQASAPLMNENAIVEYDFGLAKEPLENVPATDGCDPHDRVRDLTPSYQQQDLFFRTGEIRWFCNGVCNCDGPNEELRCPETKCN